MKNFVLSEDDQNLLDRLHRGAFDYFLDNVNPSNGLAADTSRPGSPASIAVTGFALAAYPVGVERAWIPRNEARDFTLATLRFFEQSDQGDGADVTGYKGFYYHFLDMQTGRRTWSCELSLIDTAMLMMGVMTAACYFSGDVEIEALADKLYRRIEWAWALNRQKTLAQGWRPESGFIHYGWDGYSEALMLYLLALASPSHSIPDDCYREWTMTYQWENLYGRDFLYAGPLFIHQFSQAWIDLRGIRDPFMREVNSDYFENSRRAAYIQRDYGRCNPLGFKGYSDKCWGLSAGDGPHSIVTANERALKAFGYAARGVPYGPDDGTIAPWSALAAMPFAPEIAWPTLRHMITAYPDILRDERLPSGFNSTVAASGGRGIWISEGHYGLDQGLSVLMLENFRSGLIWDLMRHAPFLKDALAKADFQGGWLV